MNDFTISYNYLMFLILLLILLYGTIKSSFKKTLTIMLLIFIIDAILGYPFEKAIHFNLFQVLFSFINQSGIFTKIGNWIVNIGRQIVQGFFG